MVITANDCYCSAYQLSKEHNYSGSLEWWFQWNIVFIVLAWAPGLAKISSLDLLYHIGTENFIKLRPKKHVKSNKLFSQLFFFNFPKTNFKKKLELSKDIRQIERFFWPGLFYIFWLTCALYEKIDVIKIKKRWITYHKKRAYEQDLDSCVFFEVVVSQKGEQLSMTSQKRLEERM